MAGETERRSRPRHLVTVLSVVVGVCLLAGATSYVMAGNIGGGLAPTPLSLSETALTPSVSIQGNFTSSGNVNGRALRISGTGMPATGTGAPSWVAATGTGGWTFASGSIARRNTGTSNSYGAARVPWMTRKQRVVGTINTITISTNAGYSILGSADGQNAVGARFFRYNPGGTTNDRWRLEIVSITAGVATTLSSGDMFANNSSNPSGSRATITIDYNPTAATPNPANFMSATAVDAVGNTATAAGVVVTGSGTYAGLISFNPTTTKYLNNYVASMQ